MLKAGLPFEVWVDQAAIRVYTRVYIHHMLNPTILVTGAAGGRQGSTGNHVTRALLKRGIPVRALVHRFDERSDQLRTLGAEVVEGDFLDIWSVRGAIRDIRRAYFAYPVQEGLLDATAIFATAAQDARLELLVNVTMLQPAPDAPTPRMRQNWLSERVFNWANVGTVHVCAPVFYENLRSLVTGSLVQGSLIQLPWGDDSTVVPLVGAEDVAQVAVGLLTGPVVANGTSYQLTGAVLTLAEIIQTFSQVLGKSIRYEPISDDQWRQSAAAHNVNPHALEHLSQLWKFFRTAGSPGDKSRYKVSDAIKKIGGKEPQTFEQFVRKQLSAFVAVPGSRDNL